MKQQNFLRLLEKEIFIEIEIDLVEKFLEKKSAFSEGGKIGFTIW
jgi:hypothetical protein